VPEEFEGNS